MNSCNYCYYILHYYHQGFLKSLLPTLQHRGHIPTPGIKVKEKKVTGAGVFNIWDSAGQAEFHVTHAMLLGTSRGIFFAVYSCMDPEEEQRKQVRRLVYFTLGNALLYMD